MKIYTKQGDKGQTRLVGGSLVSKGNLRVEAYGTLDEASSFIGAAIAFGEGFSMLREELATIQSHLLEAGALVASLPEDGRFSFPMERTRWLEGRIDFYEAQLPELKEFILPGGTPCSSFLHLARTVVRRGERHLVRLAEEEGVEGSVLAYANRLSDFLFTAARFVLL